jgi:hypothetical protein
MRTLCLNYIFAANAQERLQRALDTAAAESSAAEQRVTALAAELSTTKQQAAAAARHHGAELQTRESALGKFTPLKTML